MVTLQKESSSPTMNKTVVLYSNGNQECERARDLLTKLGGELLEYNLGKDFKENDFTNEFGSTAEYPQISIGYEHIGGLKETLNYLKDRKYI